MMKPLGTANTTNTCITINSRIHNRITIRTHITPVIRRMQMVPVPVQAVELSTVCSHNNNNIRRSAPPLRRLLRLDLAVVRAVSH
jgi:hypothetical protein